MYILEITSNDVFEKILNLTYIFCGRTGLNAENL